MYIRILNSNVGRYNLLSNEQTFNFSIAIVHNTAREIVEVDGIKAILHFEGDAETQGEFANPLDILPDVFEKCFNYSTRIWSSVPYTEQCLAFAQVYKENFELIEENMLREKNERITKDIERLTRELSKRSLLDEPVDVFNWPLAKYLQTVEKSIKRCQDDMAQYKEESKGYADSLKTLEKAQIKLEKINNAIIKNDDNT